MHIAKSTDSSYLRRYLDCKAAADQAQRALKEAESQLAAEMQEKQRKTLQAMEGDQIAQVTFVQRITYKIDEPALRKALTAKVYDKFTVKKLDRVKLEQAMESDQVDSRTVAKYVTPVPGNPYLKLTMKDKESA